MSTQFNTNPAISSFIKKKSRHHALLIRELHHLISSVPTWATSFSPHCPPSQLPWRQLGWAAPAPLILMAGSAHPMCKKTKDSS